MNDQPYMINGKSFFCAFQMGKAISCFMQSVLPVEAMIVDAIKVEHR